MWGPQSQGQGPGPLQAFSPPPWLFHILERKDLLSINWPSFALHPHRVLALSTLGLGGYQPCPSPSSSAALPLPHSCLALLVPCLLPGLQPCTNFTLHGLAKTLWGPTVGEEFQQSSHSTTDAFIGQTYSQASRGRVLAEWVTFFPTLLAVFKEQREGGGRDILIRITTSGAIVY